MDAGGFADILAGGADEEVEGAGVDDEGGTLTLSIDVKNTGERGALPHSGEQARATCRNVAEIERGSGITA